MVSKLFAFQVAKPLESALEDQDMPGPHYDPKTQMLQWQGEGRAQASYWVSWCTTAYKGGFKHCISYTNGTCEDYGYGPKPGTGYRCDFAFVG